MHPPSQCTRARATQNFLDSDVLETRIRDVALAQLEILLTASPTALGIRLNCLCTSVLNRLCQFIKNVLLNLSRGISIAGPIRYFAI